MTNADKTQSAVSVLPEPDSTQAIRGDWLMMARDAVVSLTIVVIMLSLVGAWWAALAA